MANQGQNGLAYFTTGSQAQPTVDPTDDAFESERVQLQSLQERRNLRRLLQRVFLQMPGKNTTGALALLLELYNNKTCCLNEVRFLSNLFTSK